MLSLLPFAFALLAGATAHAADSCSVDSYVDDELASMSGVPFSDQVANILQNQLSRIGAGIAMGTLTEADLNSLVTQQQQIRIELAGLKKDGSWSEQDREAILVALKTSSKAIFLAKHELDDLMNRAGLISIRIRELQNVGTITKDQADDLRARVDSIGQDYQKRAADGLSCQDKVHLSTRLANVEQSITDLSANASGSEPWGDDTTVFNREWHLGNRVARCMIRNEVSTADGDNLAHQVFAIAKKERTFLGDGVLSVSDRADLKSSMDQVSQQITSKCQVSTAN